MLRRRGLNDTIERPNTSGSASVKEAPIAIDFKQPICFEASSKFQRRQCCTDVPVGQANDMFETLA